MNKRILIISSSPRRNGNSEILCNEFAKGASENGNDVEILKLREKKIGYCKACYACSKNGKCIQKDDVEEILDKMQKCDILVLATPVYFYSMNAQLKVLIDRTLPLYLKMKNKAVYLIAAAEDSDPKSLERTMEGFRGFMDCYEGFIEKGAIYAAGVYQIGDVLKTKYPQEAYEMGKNS